MSKINYRHGIFQIKKRWGRNSWFFNSSDGCSFSLGARTLTPILAPAHFSLDAWQCALVHQPDVVALCMSEYTHPVENTTNKCKYFWCPCCVHRTSPQRSLSVSQVRFHSPFVCSGCSAGISEPDKSESPSSSHCPGFWEPTPGCQHCGSCSWVCPVGLPAPARGGSGCCRDSANSCRLCLLQGKLEQNNYYHCVFHPYFIVAIIFISVRG